ncbi:MAG: diguanylate cyclase [Clostridia bacterium]
MNIKESISNFIENYGNSFFVLDIKTEKVLFANKRAIEIFNVTLENCDLKKILATEVDPFTIDIKKILNEKSTTMFYNVKACIPNRDSIQVDLQVGYFNDDKTAVFLEVIPMNDLRLDMSVHHVKESFKAEAIVNFDKNLSIVYCNDAFCTVFDSNQDTINHHLKEDFINGFILDGRERLVNEILSNLNKKPNYTTKIEILTAKGEKTWYLIDFERRTLDSSGVDKILICMTNIESQIEIAEHYSDIQQYLSVMQEVTENILYHTDITTKTMYLYSDIGEKSGIERIIPNYIDIFMESDLIHPDDKELYMENHRDFHERDIPPKHPIRFAFANDEYLWYEINARKIYDSQGNVKDIFGILVNIQDELEIKEQNSTLNQYLKAMQEISDDVLFRIDVETVTMHHLTDDGEAGTFSSVPNFIDNLLTNKIIHPDDAKKYEQYAQDWYDDKIDGCSLRFLVDNDTYEWFDVQVKKIFDDQGNLKEVFGKLVNIQENKELKQNLDFANKYLSVMQELSDDILYRVDVKTSTLYHSHKGKMLIPYVSGIPDHINTIIKDELVHPDDAKKYKKDVDDWYADKIDIITARFKFDDEYLWYDIHSQKILDEHGELVEIYAKMTNIDDKVTIKKEFSALNQYFLAMQTLSNKILFRIDLKTKTFYHTDTNGEGFGVSTEIVNFVDTFIENEFIHPEDCEIYRKYTDDLFNGICKEIDIRSAIDVGVFEYFNIKSQFIYDENGIPSEVFGTMENIQWKKELEQKATIDLMTQVYNKVSFENKTCEILNDYPTDQHALIFIDLDDFKGVNDTLGHRFGDYLLTSVGKRLKRVTRDTDIVGRIGGDEFAVLLKGVSSDISAMKRSEVLLEALKREFSFEGKTRKIKASIGIAIYPIDGSEYAKLIHNADIALYFSKEKGKDTATLYNDDMQKN